MQKTSLTARISAAALLALGALPIAALSTAAHAATTVKIGDLNLASVEGQAIFAKRAEHAARLFCGGERDPRASITCRRGVKAELNEKVAAIQAHQTFAAR